MSSAMLGGVVVGASVAAATLVCTGLCLALWCRRLRAQAGDPSPATFLVSKRKPGPYSSSDHPMAFVLPTITHSEAGSEPHTPTSTTLVTPTGERPRWVGRSIYSPPHPHARTHDPGGDTMMGVGGGEGMVVGGVNSNSSGFYSPPLPTPLPLPHQRTPYQRPRSASPNTLLPKTTITTPTTSPPPPLSLPLVGRRWTTGTQTTPITPATPPALLPRSIFLRKGMQGLEDIRAALQHSFLTSDLTSPDPAEVTTPDSVDSWAPVWTPASSIGSGGGCGLGEVRLRLRYTLRARQLHLQLHSAHQLPRRLGPHPIDTYIKAVLLPEKRVRFTTAAVPATDRATFHANFTHDARPSRLTHVTLRLSVCQVTECGKRVVVGYASLNLSSLGLNPSLVNDLDTGLLNLHLQESAPDQQVGAGGQLEVGLGWDRVVGDLCIRVWRFTSLHLPTLSHTLYDTSQVYVKVTVYLNNSILCWRRTSPKDLDGGRIGEDGGNETLTTGGKRDSSSSPEVEAKGPPPGGGGVLEVDEQLTLHMPELDLDATHLVISARLRTRPGCGRRVVGSCLVGRGGCVGDEGREHWQDMLRAAPELVTRSYTLAVHATYHDPLLSPHSIQDPLKHVLQDPTALPCEPLPSPPSSHSHEDKHHHSSDQSSSRQQHSFDHPSSRHQHSFDQPSSHQHSFDQPNSHQQSFDQLSLHEHPSDQSIFRQRSYDQPSSHQHSSDRPISRQRSYDQPNARRRQHSFDDSHDHTQDLYQSPSYEQPPTYDESVASGQCSYFRPPTYSEAFAIPLDPSSPVHVSYNPLPDNQRPLQQQQQQQQHRRRRRRRLQEISANSPDQQKIQTEDILPAPVSRLPPQPSRPPPSLLSPSSPPLSLPTLPLSPSSPPQTPSSPPLSLPTPLLQTPSIPPLSLSTSIPPPPPPPLTPPPSSHISPQKTQPKQLSLKPTQSQHPGNTVKKQSQSGQSPHQTQPPQKESSSQPQSPQTQQTHSQQSQSPPQSPSQRTPPSQSPHQDTTQLPHNTV